MGKCAPIWLLGRTITKNVGHSLQLPAACVPQASSELESMLRMSSTDLCPTNVPVPALLKNQSHHLVLPRFVLARRSATSGVSLLSLVQFTKQFSFHFFYPFSIPAVIWIDGWQANKVVRVWADTKPFTFVKQ